MKINPKQYITPQTSTHKTSQSQLKVTKHGFTGDKVELSEKAQEHLTLRQAKTDVTARVEGQFSSARLHEIKAQIQNNEFKVDHDAIVDAMMHTVSIIKGK